MPKRGVGVNATEQHKVFVTGRVPKRGRPKYWAFGLADFEVLLGLSPEGVRTAIKDGRLDPKSLKSICLFWERRQRLHPELGSGKAQ